MLICEPKVFNDDRGFFFESFNQKLFNEAVGYHVEFVQDNHSFSKKGVLRGMHLQKHPYMQGKLVRCVSGEVFDVAVDVRLNSETFGKWVGVYLSEENKKQLWIPAGFAHGFLTLSEHAELLYKATCFYSPGSEISINYKDSDIKIDWPNVIESPLLSEKDRNSISLKDYQSILMR
ncbi:dTDP-4-dehydrorhamnose 3,5-epimerase [Edwardsiella tarda]|uniref:dTDP-4-dehydrorhamnose 3,5-epimerase n=1 Tax=Edwardsiella tarda TaxID=636 RepID=UPI00351CA12C